MAGQQQQPAPRHVPLSEITHQGLLRALGAEAETLEKIHVRIQRQLQNLEMEEKLIKQMIQRERNAQSPEDLQQFDLEQQQQQEGAENLQQRLQQQQQQEQEEEAAQPQQRQLSPQQQQQQEQLNQARLQQQAQDEPTSMQIDQPVPQDQHLGSADTHPQQQQSTAIARI